MESLKDPVFFYTLISIPFVFILDNVIIYKSISNEYNLNTCYYNLHKNYKLFKVIIYKILFCMFLADAILFPTVGRYGIIIIAWIYYSNVLELTIKFMKYKNYKKSD